MPALMLIGAGTLFYIWYSSFMKKIMITFGLLLLPSLLLANEGPIPTHLDGQVEEIIKSHPLESPNFEVKTSVKSTIKIIDTLHSSSIIKSKPFKSISVPVQKQSFKDIILKFLRGLVNIF
jgi:hypothetical protein